MSSGPGGPGGPGDPGEPGDPDLEIFERWRGGDRRAGRELFSKYFDSLRGYFLNAVGDAERDDLVQESFRRLLSGIENFRGDSSFRTYLFSIARFTLYDHYRRSYRGNGNFDPLTHSVDDPHGVSPSHVVTAIERHQLLLACMRRLPVETKQMLELYYWHGLTGREIGEHLGVKERTARSRISAAKALLREWMQSAGQSKLVIEGASLDDQLRELGDFFVSGRVTPRDE